MYGVSINKKRPEDYGLDLIDIDRPLLPNRNYSETEIQERPGAELEVNEYKNILVSITVCFTQNNLSEKRQKAREVAYWLRKECKLIFDDEPDKYYLGWALDGTEFSSLADIGSATITFTCKPFAYGIELGQKNFNVGHNRDIGYKGTAEAPTRIIITNKCNKTINGIKITTINKGE